MKPDEQLDHTPLTFGKYIGKTPSEIADTDPGYIVYLWNNHDVMRTSKLLYEACLEDVQEKRRQNRVAWDQSED